MRSEFVVADLGTADEFALARLLGAQNFPMSAESFVDDLGYERRDKVLMYAPTGDVDASDPRVGFHRKQKYVKEVLLLQGNALNWTILLIQLFLMADGTSLGGSASFAQQYPFLLLRDDRPQADDFLVYPSQMLPSPSGVFLGSQITSSNRKVLQDLRISYVRHHTILHRALT